MLNPSHNQWQESISLCLSGDDYSVWKIVTWSIRGTNGNDLTNEMAKWKIDILCFCETNDLFQMQSLSIFLFLCAKRQKNEYKTKSMIDSIVYDERLIELGKDTRMMRDPKYGKNPYLIGPRVDHEKKWTQKKMK